MRRAAQQITEEDPRRSFASLERPLAHGAGFRYRPRPTPKDMRRRSKKLSLGGPARRLSKEDVAARKSSSLNTSTCSATSTLSSLTPVADAPYSSGEDSNEDLGAGCASPIWISKPVSSLSSGKAARAPSSPFLKIDPPGAENVSPQILRNTPKGQFSKTPGSCNSKRKSRTFSLGGCPRRVSTPNSAKRPRSSNLNTTQSGSLPESSEEYQIVNNSTGSQSSSTSSAATSNSVTITGKNKTGVNPMIDAAAKSIVPSRQGGKKINAFRAVFGSASTSSSESSARTTSQSNTTRSLTACASSYSRSWVQSDFKVGAALGQGKFGYVYSATALASRKKVALKILPKAQLRGSSAAMLQLRREVEIHSRLRHKNIIEFLGYFHDPKQVFIVLEKCSRGHLYSELRKRGALPESEAARFVSQIANALAYCHARSVIHRDLKPENILLDGEGKLKLADFGWAVHVPGRLDGTRTTLCGSPAYVSPEIVEGRPHGHWTDLWSLGVMVYEMVFASLPFEASSQDGIFQRIRAVDLPRHLLTKNDQVPDEEGTVMAPMATSSVAVKSLIRGLLQYRQKMRSTLESVLACEWIAGNNAMHE